MTGTLAPPLLDPSHPDYAHSMDIVFGTYWFYPAKTGVILPEDEKCIQAKMANESVRFNPRSEFQLSVTPVPCKSFFTEDGSCILQMTIRLMGFIMIVHKNPKLCPHQLRGHKDVNFCRYLLWYGPWCIWTQSARRMPWKDRPSTSQPWYIWIPKHLQPLQHPYGPDDCVQVRTCT